MKQDRKSGKCNNKTVRKYICDEEESKKSCAQLFGQNVLFISDSLFPLKLSAKLYY